MVYPRQLEDSMSTKLLTPEQLEDLAWRQLVVRVVVEDLPEQGFQKPSVQTTIILITASRDENGNQFFYKVTYTDIKPEQGGRNFFGNMVGLDLKGYGNDAEERRGPLEETIQQWRQDLPPWASMNPVVVIKKEGKEIRGMPPSELVVMQHYARFQTRIAYEIQNPERGWILNAFFYRLDAFIQVQDNSWVKLIQALT